MFSGEKSRTGISVVLQAASSRNGSTLSIVQGDL